MNDHMEIQPIRRGVLSRERRPYEAAVFERVIEPSTVPDLRKVMQILWYRRGAVLVVFFLVFLGVLAGTFLQKPVYRAMGTLEIRRESANAVPPETLFNLIPISPEYLQTEYGILRSTTLAGRVINELNLAKEDEFQPPFWKKWISAPTPPTLEALAEKFETLLIVNPVPGSWLVQVTFDAFDAGRSARIVNSVISNYIRLRMEEGEKSSDWLSAQLRGTESKLKDAEDRLRRYTRANGLQLLESDKGDADNLVNDRLRQLQDALTQAQAARYSKESEASFVRDGQKDGALNSLDSPVIQNLTVRLAEQKREYAMLMSAFLPEYPKAKEVRNQIDELEAQLRIEREREAARRTTDYLAAVEREKLVRNALESQKSLANRLAEKTPGYNTLKREVDTNKQLYTVLQQKLKEIGVSTALKATNVGIIDLAQPPPLPDQPKPLVNLVLGGMLGVLLGVAAAFMREHLDTRLKTVEEVDNLLDLPALGMIPSAKSLMSSGIARRLASSLGTAGFLQGLSPGRQFVDSEAQRPSTLTNAFAALRTAVLFPRVGSAPHSLLVTSSRPGEGKTTVSVNLAISLGLLGKRVLLVDADARRPSVHRLLALQNNPGLTTYLSGDEDWKRFVHHASGISVLPAGRPSPESTELLSSPRMKSLLAEAAQCYDFIVLDSPALFINLADARILSEAVDGSVLVVRSGFTPREVALRALEHAKNVIGVVVNDLNLNVLPGYYRDYYEQARGSRHDGCTNETASRPGGYLNVPGTRPV